jgi:PKD repeat protein
MLKRFLGLLFTSVVLVANAQESGVCGHDVMMEQILSEHPELSSTDYEYDPSIYENLIQTEDGPEGIVHFIPVVFHVMYANEEDNISREQILDGLRVMNEDFRRMNADANQTRAIFQSRSVDTEIEFRLATKDANGNCHSGIIRKFSTLTVGASNNVKSGLQGSPSWDNNKYLNIWTVRSIDIGSGPNVLGYAYRPANFANCSTCVSSQSSSFDGIVVRHDNVGAIGTGSDPDLGNASNPRTLTHEAGHYLNLHHTFYRGNPNNADCVDANGDNIADTPPSLINNFGCNTGTNSCNNDSPDLPDMIENFMDYADCSNAYTIGQRNEMKRAIGLSTWRGDVTSGANLQATGAAPDNYDCVPTSFFIADKRWTCEGGSVQFHARPQGGNAQTYSWNFPGGSPATSSASDPSVTYNQAGTYPVTLTLSNPNGSSDSTIQSFVTVSSPSTAQSQSLSEDFETSSFPGTDWATHGMGDYIDFQITDNAGFQSSKSLFLDNFNATWGQTENLYSKSLDVRFATSLSLRFKHAFTTKRTGDDDMMRIYVSDDCGQSWTLTRIVNTSTLSTVAAQTSAFIPTSDSDWDEYTVNLNSYAGSNEPIQIRWEFLSGGGNNLYLDDINIDITLSTEEIGGNTLSVYPNPTKGSIVLETRNPLGIAPLVQLTDVGGRTIPVQLHAEGVNWRIDFPSSLTEGVYFLRVESENGAWNERILLRR